MPKPRLPQEIEQKLPADMVRLIYSFLASETPKQKSPQMSHIGQTAIRAFQTSPKLKGKNDMYLYGLDDFLLPR